MTLFFLWARLEVGKDLSTWSKLMHSYFAATIKIKPPPHNGSELKQERQSSWASWYSSEEIHKHTFEQCLIIPRSENYFSTLFNDILETVQKKLLTLDSANDHISPNLFVQQAPESFILRCKVFLQ